MYFQTTAIFSKSKYTLVLLNMIFENSLSTPNPQIFFS